MKALKLFGTSHIIQSEYARHKWNVSLRRTMLKNQALDVDNGCYEPETQVYVESFKGTHPKRKSIISYLLELLP